MRALLLLSVLLLFSQPTWAQRWQQEDLDSLASAKILKMVSLQDALEDWDGSNPYQLLSLEGGLRAVFRSEDEAWGSVAEYVAFRVDSALETELVPPTVLRTLTREEIGEAWPWDSDSRTGSIQLFVEGARSAEPEDLSATDRANSEILSFLLGRYDNHSGNLLLVPDGRGVVLDFEGSLDIQKVRYGDFPFLRRGGWHESSQSLKSSDPFPFDQPKVLVDPTLEEIQDTFGPWWGQFWPQGMKLLHRLLRGIPERKIPYAIWNNRLWVQVKVRSRHPAYTAFFPTATMKKLEKLDEAALTNILVPPFRKDHLNGMLNRKYQLMRAYHGGR